MLARVVKRIIAKEMFLIANIFIAIVLLAGCSNFSTEAVYKSKYGCSFKYPRYLHAQSFGAVKKIASEALLLYEKVPVEGIAIYIINIDRAADDVFSGGVKDYYRKYVKYGSGERKIVIGKDNIAIFFNQYFVSIDCARPVSPPAIRSIPCKDIALDIAKSTEFSKQKITNTIIINSNEDVENLIKVINAQSSRATRH